MAERLLFGTAERIIETLVSLTAKKIPLWGVKDELQCLKKTVSEIKAVVLDAEEKQAGNDAIRDWLGMLADAIYDADDLLDAISTEALQREIMTLDKEAKMVRIFFSLFNRLAYRYRMGNKIKKITQRLDTINANRGIFNLVVRHAETPIGNMERDNTHSFVRADEVIGREDDKNAVIYRLLDSNVIHNVQILPIVGIGGLGKTALAQLIFNDAQIQKHFELRMWVCVSNSFDVNNIVEKIIESVTKKKPKIGSMPLEDYLKEKINRRYLLVLDDVWNEDYEKWSRLIQLLMGGAIGSRILVTTRDRSIARITETVPSYSLSGLDECASWSLFKSMAFEKGQEQQSASIKALAREILEKCSGVPLAIRTIGSLLRSKDLEREWPSFKNYELSKIPQTENDILPTLKLSYDQLPSHLKHCFAYCSLFPKNYIINKSTLIKLWIAQGFVMSLDQNRFLEDAGDQYFKVLHGISFFKEAERDEVGNIIGCKIPDLMHELAILVAGSFTTILDDNNINVDEKTRHVSFDINVSSVDPTLLKKASRIRTFLRLGDYSGAEIDCATIFSSLKVLRVLDMHKSNLDYVPSSIEKLKHLRYLDLSENYKIKELPDSITKLQNLQTLRLSECRSLKELPRDIKKLVNLIYLEIDGCRSLEELPRDIKKLINLRHLDIDDCCRLTYMPRGLGQLTNLQKLSRFLVHSRHSDSGGLKELNQLNNLKGKLVIENLEHDVVASDYEVANLLEKQHLHALELWWSSHEDDNDLDANNNEASLEGFQPHLNLKDLFFRKYRGSKLPSWFSSLSNLVRFELSWCKKLQDLSQLSQLPSLKYLVLISLDAMEYISDGGDSNEKIRFFPSLKEFRLSCCLSIKGWWRRDSFVEVNSDSHNSVKIEEDCLLPSFPCLSSLSISSCPMLTSMPMFPHLEEKLVLDNSSLKLLQQIMRMNMATPQSSTSTSTASSSFIPLSKLKYMELNSIADLETLPEEWLQNLTSLESLKIGSCNRLKSLPSGLQHATTLQKLEISNCVSLTAIPDWIHDSKSLKVFKLLKFVAARV